MATHRADARQFLDERGSANIALTPNGLNPSTILEKAVRERIIESFFFKDQCFGVNEADIVDRVVRHVRFVGGTYGSSQKPTPFLCLAFKLLQLAPSDAVLREYLGFGGDKFKYLRALALFYVRLTRTGPDVYKTLEPYLEDRRKLRRKARAGTSLTFVDQFVDDLLTKDRVCATSLWQMGKREMYEDLDQLEPRVSPLGDIEDLLDEDDEDNENKDNDEEEDDVEMLNNGGNSDGTRNSDDDEGEVREDDSDRRDRRGSSEDRRRGEDRERSDSRSPRRSRSRDQDS
ncbi:PRP38 family-domain-containing protein [Apiospora kogelbergensis]|uniref:Pre-mRNA-splicing factor 38 n=1 Tax=Apiospora kogelbergensis TaxID=1337665 RepID=A0AAW0QRW2_9PEZI